MIFIDTNVFISYYNEDDENHRISFKVIKDIEEDKYGPAFISDYIFDEIMTVSLMKTKDKEKTIRFGLSILKSNIKMLKVNQEIFKRTWQLFHESKIKMSFTDFTNLVFLKKFNIEYLATFDKDFRRIRGIHIIDR